MFTSLGSPCFSLTITCQYAHQHILLTMTTLDILLLLKCLILPYVAFFYLRLFRQSNPVNTKCGISWRMVTFVGLDFWEFFLSALMKVCFGSSESKQEQESPVYYMQSASSWVLWSCCEPFNIVALVDDLPTTECIPRIEKKKNWLLTAVRPSGLFDLVQRANSLSNMQQTKKTFYQYSIKKEPLPVNIVSRCILAPPKMQSGRTSANSLSLMGQWGRKPNASGHVTTLTNVIFISFSPILTNCTFLALSQIFGHDCNSAAKQ